MTNSFAQKPNVPMPLDDAFRPIALANRAFLAAVRASGNGVPLVLVTEQGDGSRSVLKTEVFPEGHEQFSANLPYVERWVKTLLWQRGGCTVYVGGPKAIGQHIAKTYSNKGAQKFDVEHMSAAYEKPFRVKITTAEKVPAAKEDAVLLGRHLDGCRIGFDLGASDHKVSAVINGNVVWSAETVWDPAQQADPDFHFHEIMSDLHRAAARMPRVDAIGGSAAGIYVNNRVRIGSLYRAVPKNIFKKKCRDMFLRIAKEWKVPFDLVNDGEVTALAGSMSLGANSVLGIALGSSEAGGYVTAKGAITKWLNELAFVPVDVRDNAPLDEWSGDGGCGVQYFSQQAVARLAPVAGIDLPADMPPAEKLKAVQELLAKNDERAKKIFETVGVYLGYGVANYADMYPTLDHVLILGRVTSGEGGNLILARANDTLAKEFPELAKRIQIHLPDEKSRRVGQSIAAASLPDTKKRKKK